MKAFISVDLEGLPGVASLTMVSPWSSQFSIASKVMTRLVNATVDELFKNGFTEVLVADSHGYMTNINYVELDSRGFSSHMSSYNLMWALPHLGSPASRSCFHWAWGCSGLPREPHILST